MCLVSTACVCRRVVRVWAVTPGSARARSKVASSLEDIAEKLERMRSSLDALRAAAQPATQAND
jgi:hypothetical protein